MSLGPESELRYMIQWFNEWNEYEKDDFLPIIVDIMSKDGVYMNGVLNGMAMASVNDKPLSLFQCRMKLFKEWSPKWSDSMKTKLVEKINEMDEDFGEKLQQELSSVLSVVANGSSSTNGDLNTDDFPTPDVQVEENGILIDLASNGGGQQLIDINSN